MLANRIRFLQVFAWMVMIPLVLCLFMAPVVHAQSNHASAVQPSAPTQSEASRTYTVSIAPNNSTTFTVQARSMAVSSRAALPTPAIQVPPPDDPGDPDIPEMYSDARVIGQNVPTQMEAGRAYTISVTMYNSGTSTWARAEQYTLMTQSPGNNMIWGFNRVSLPSDFVSPGQSATFTFQVTAPGTPGQYTSQWSMQQGGHGSFGGFTAPVTVNVVAPVLVSNAQVVGQSVPTQMEAGKRYNLSVTMYNSGSTTWTRAEQYTLMTQSPGNNTMWGFNRVSLPFDSVAPGQTATFAFQVTAPAAPGQYVSQWSMQQEGHGSFGGFTEPLTVNVIAPLPSLGNVTFIHTDGLGSPVARTDGAGNLISRTYYEPYGNTAAGAQPTIGFTGHVNDVDTGLTYMEQRYYDPVAGRFLSLDPETTDVKTGLGFNRYVYANNSPNRYVDPDGRDAVDKFGDRFKKDMENGNGDIYKPLQLFAVAATAVILVGPPAIAIASETAVGAGVATGVTKATTATTTSEVIGTTGFTRASEVGRNIIRWGERQTEGGVSKTIARTQEVNTQVVQGMKDQGLPKSWVEGQLSSYVSKAGQGGKALENKQLIPRIDLMIKILKNWGE